MSIPDNMRIVHARDFTEQPGYAVERYFRLFHGLDVVSPVRLAGYSVRRAEKADIPAIVSIINASYPDISVTEARMEALACLPVYTPELWILAEERNTGRAVGCAIADCDRTVGEGILEWVQVLPDFRRQGIGRLLVTSLLERMRESVEFATVSGKEAAAQRLYRSCGFGGDDVWYICTKR